MDIPDVDAPAKFEQRDMILLHGAYKCMQREARAQATCKEPWRCYVARCLDMRSVVKHMMSCPIERKCSWPVSCSSLRQEVKRLTGCEEVDCPICVQKKEWQAAVSAEQRSNLVDLLVQAASNSSLHDKVLYAQKIERETYYKADNLTDYYRVLADAKWEAEMAGQEKRKQNRVRLQANVNLQANIFGERRLTGRRSYRLTHYVHRRVRPNYQT